MVDLGRVSSAMAATYGVKEGSHLLEYDFVLVTKDAARKLKEDAL